MSFIFGGAPPTTAELARHFKTKIGRSIREIDREAARMKGEERVLMGEMKAAAANNLKLTLQKAKAVVRTRRTLNKFSSMKSHLQGISARIQNVKSMESLNGAVAGAAKMMAAFNQVMGGRALCSSLTEMERQTASMNLHSEMVDERMDDVFDEDEDENDIDNVVSSILLEAGIKLPDAIKTPAAELSLEERFERLLPSVPVRSQP